LLNGLVEQSNKWGANDAMNININVPTDNPTTPHFVKTNIPNLIKLEPMGTYYGRCKVHGKLVRQSLETKDFKVAKKKILQWLIDTRGRVNAHEGNMGKLSFEVTKRDAYSIPLFPPLKKLLEKIKKAAGGEPHGLIFKVKSIRRVLRSACKAVHTPFLTHHDLRHYFATRCMENPAIDIPTISRWLGQCLASF